MKGKKSQKIFLGVWAAAIVVIGAGGAILFWPKDGGPIPAKIRHEISFTILETQPKTDWRILPRSVSYNLGTGVLSMVATSGEANMNIDEQSQPEVFSDSPQVYPALLNKMNQYEDLQTAIGTVTLTHPKELNGGQTAVINLRQALIFIKPSTNLSDSQWKSFFGSMQWD